MVIADSDHVRIGPLVALTRSSEPDDADLRTGRTRLISADTKTAAARTAQDQQMASRELLGNWICWVSEESRDSSSHDLVVWFTVSALAVRAAGDGALQVTRRFGHAGGIFKDRAAFQAAKNKQPVGGLSLTNVVNMTLRPNSGDRTEYATSANWVLSWSRQGGILFEEPTSGTSRCRGSNGTEDPLALAKQMAAWPEKKR
jgi:hypothetical protein